jgi:hypothetical protein
LADDLLGLGSEISETGGVDIDHPTVLVNGYAIGAQLDDESVTLC